jgi:hypothetical protein
MGVYKGWSLGGTHDWCLVTDRWIDCICHFDVQRDAICTRKALFACPRLGPDENAIISKGAFGEVLHETRPPVPREIICQEATCSP